MSAFRSEGRWAPHTTRSWQFLGFEEGLINPPDGREWLPSLDKSSEDIIVGILDSGESALHLSTHRVRRFNHVLICLLACTGRDLAGVEELQRPRARAGAGAVERDVMVGPSNPNDRGSVTTAF